MTGAGPENYMALVQMIWPLWHCPVSHSGAQAFYDSYHLPNHPSRRNRLTNPAVHSSFATNTWGAGMAILKGVVSHCLLAF